MRTLRFVNPVTDEMVNVYRDRMCTDAHTQPIVAGQNGVFPPIFHREPVDRIEREGPFPPNAVKGFS